MSVSNILLPQSNSWSNLDVNSISVAQNINAPNQPGRSYRYGTNGQTLVTATDSIITMGLTDQWNNGGCTDNGSGLITIGYSGIYFVSISLLFRSNTAAGARAVWAIKSGDSLRYCWSQVQGLTSGFTVVAGSALIKFTAGQTLQFYANQTSGSDVVIGDGTGGSNNSIINIIKVA